MMDVMCWPVFPGEVIGLSSPLALRTIAMDTLRLSAAWGQANSFCSVYSQAARVGMPAQQWLPEMEQVIKAKKLLNFVVYQGGGGVEVAGALQVIADLMLQSVTDTESVSGTSVMHLFPLAINNSSIRFHRLRGKGAFVVSSSWNNVTMSVGDTTLESEVGGPATLAYPYMLAAVRVIDDGGEAVSTSWKPGASIFRFATQAGTNYSIAAGKKKG